MNTAWGYLWRALRSTLLSTAEHDDALEQLRRHGLAYPGWPTNESAWLAAARTASMDVRGSYRVFMDFLADALVEWSTDVLVFPGSTDYTFTWTGVGPEHQNRLLRTQWGTFMLGHFDGTDIHVARGCTYWADPAVAWDEMLTEGAFTGNILPFMYNELGPSYDDPVVYTFSGPVQFVYKGKPCVIELRLMDGFIDLMPPWPWLYEDASEAYEDGTWGTVLYDDASQVDTDYRGIYLADEDGTNLIPNMSDVLERNMLPAGIRLAVDVGLGVFDRAVPPVS